MKFHLKVWRQAGPDQPGRFEEYTVDNILPEMSFLEMLDQLNEELIRQDKEPIAFDSDCREGICGTCGLVIDGMAHGPSSGAPPASCACANSPTALRSRSSLSGPTPFRSSKTWSSTAAPWTASSPPAATSRSTPGRPRTPTPSSSPRTSRKRPWTQRPASGAGHASRPAPTPRPLCSRGEDFPARPPAPGPSRAGKPGPPHGGADGRGRLRRLLQPRRMRGRVPQGHLHRQHRPHAPGVHQGQPRRRPGKLVGVATTRKVTGRRQEGRHPVAWTGVFILPPEGA